jgi:uncharacterized SAM-binding protein YcdF (DUF218 family)
MLWRHLGPGAPALAVAAAVIALGIPIAHLLLLPLEGRFAKPALAPAKVDGIIV